MEFRLLGQFELCDGDRTHHLGGPMQRTLLAHLLLVEGRAMTSDDLIERLWGGAASQASIRTLHVHVLRRLLGASGCAARIDTCSSGYRLDLDADVVDAAQFHEWIATAAQARESGDVLGELDALGTALAWWRGDALSGVGGDWPRFAEVRALAETRDAARERRATCLLATGNPADAVADLRALAHEHPDRESVRYLLMLALHRAGRRAEALACYDDTHRYVTGELGLGPGQSLRELHRVVLSGIAEGSTPDRAGVTPRPHALPARSARLFGRDAEIDLLVTALRGDRRQCLITGMPAAGKSALALHVAHAVRDDHPDGQLYANLGTAEPKAVLGRFLRLLGVRAIPGKLDERVELFRAHTTGKRILVLLDDVASAAAVRALLPGDGPVTVIVTSRRTLGAVDAARCPLGVLAEADALAVLADVAGARRIGLEQTAARLIVARCGGVPLAVRVAGGLLAARPSWPVATVADLLADERTRLDRLVCDDLSMGSRIATAYERLADPERRAFRLLGLLPAGSVTTSTVAALLDIDPSSARYVLESLVDAGLVGADGHDYRLAEVFRLYAREQAESHDPAGIRTKARRWLSVGGPQAKR